MIVWESANWAQLSNDQLYAILQLRSEVFVVEQNCVYQDFDDADQQCIHLWTSREGSIVAYARLVPPGRKYADPSIGRVVTSRAVRGGGLGKQLMAESIRRCRSQWPQFGIRISAQSHLKKFYSSFGFQPVGEEYLEDDIPHTEMYLDPLN